MADNSLRTPGSGESIASDDIGGVKWQRVKVAVGADGAAVDVQPPGDGRALSAIVGVGPMLYNGATGDLARGNLEGTLLASAARTATVQTAEQTNHNARGIIVILHATVAGTGGLTLYIRTQPSGAGTAAQLLAAPQVTTATIIAAVMYPGAAATNVGVHVTDVVSLPLPRSWHVRVEHADASSWTYEVRYSLIV